ncbi:hypothetical protein HW130_11815 [Streptomyces sp. PKU-EA00015]|uniref:hypothetical protein n=1 Tax=Streptomyces sp. PKU-EA00015 TaxID=2748326 RepID=UPI0015A195FE|nr:hypothetical protein [Streptomyces sp. PKU-EA00015]NWF26948.1 hypothetical protein [Streptomyces sp. PKU-EA00015]
MAGSSKKSQDESVLYFWTKGEADAFKHKLNGLSTTVDLLKVGVAGVALGFTPVKIDPTLFKVDEKGITWAGVQKWTWPHARDEKGRLEAAEKRLDKIQKRADASYSRSEKALRNAQEMARRAGAGSWAGQQEARRASSARQDSIQALKDVRGAHQKIVRLQNEARMKAEAIEENREAAAKAARDLQTRINSLRSDFNALSRSVSGQ